MVFNSSKFDFGEKMSQKKNFVFFLNCLCAFGGFCCFLLFALLMADVWGKFSEKMTTTGIRFSVDFTREILYKGKDQIA